MCRGKTERDVASAKLSPPARSDSAANSIVGSSCDPAKHAHVAPASAVNPAARTAPRNPRLRQCDNA